MKDFLVAHYTCGRNDTEFWKHIDSGATETDFVKAIREVCKYRVPNSTMFPRQEGSAGWPLWSYVLAGTGALKDHVARQEIMFNNDERLGHTAYIYHVDQFHIMSENLPDNTSYIRGN